MTGAVNTTAVGEAVELALLLAGMFPGAGQTIALIAKAEPAVMGLLTALNGVTTQNRGLTDDERATMNAQIEANSAKLEAAAAVAERVLADRQEPA